MSVFSERYAWDPMREAVQASPLLAIALSATGSGLGAPWWAVAVSLISFAVALGVACVARAVMPDRSADRLAWWQDRRRYLERRKRQRRSRRDRNG